MDQRKFIVRDIRGRWNGFHTHLHLLPWVTEYNRHSYRIPGREQHSVIKVPTSNRTALEARDHYPNKFPFHYTPCPEARRAVRRPVKMLKSMMALCDFVMALCLNFKLVFLALDNRLTLIRLLRDARTLVLEQVSNTCLTYVSKLLD